MGRHRNRRPWHKSRAVLGPRSPPSQGPSQTVSANQVEVSEPRWERPTTSHQSPTPAARSPSPSPSSSYPSQSGARDNNGEDVRASRPPVAFDQDHESTFAYQQEYSIRGKAEAQATSNASFNTGQKRALSRSPSPERSHQYKRHIDDSSTNTDLQDRRDINTPSARPLSDPEAGQWGLSRGQLLDRIDELTRDLEECRARNQQVEKENWELEEALRVCRERNEYVEKENGAMKEGIKKHLVDLEDAHEGLFVFVRGERKGERE